MLAPGGGLAVALALVAAAALASTWPCVCGATTGLALKEMTVVTAADHTHRCVLLNLLRSIHASNPGTHVVVYDIGVSGAHPSLDLPSLTKAAGLDTDGHRTATLRRFPYKLYPRWFNVNESAGEYAWKPAIIKMAADEFGLVLWMDAGDEVSPTRGGLGRIEALVKAKGFYSPASTGKFTRWTHNGMLRHFGLPLHKHATWSNCNAALVGMNRDSLAYKLVLEPWHACAMNRSCIAPKGSSRRNHRQDQAALSCVVHLTGDKYHCRGVCNNGRLCGGTVKLRADDEHHDDC